MVETKDIYWLAGLLEGEGAFTTNGKPDCPTISLKMSDMDTVQRANAILRRSQAGHPSIYIDHSGIGTRDQYQIRLSGYRAAGWMMTLYPLMGKRRQARIRELLTGWLAAKKGRGVYKVGTPFGNVTMPVAQSRYSN